jgi:protein-disulfide isomerase
MMRLSTMVVVLVCGVMLFACQSAAPAVPTPTPPPTPVATSTTVPTVITDVFEGLPTGTTAAGFPTLGADDAPVTAQVFGSYASDATRRLHQDVLVPLLARVAAGEVRYVYVPLPGAGASADGTGGARAALCAGEQGAFWDYHAALFGQIEAQGANATLGASLFDIAVTLALDPAAWEACVGSTRPDDVLVAAETAAADEPFFSGTPTVLLNGAYMLNDRVSIERVLEQMLVRVDSETGVVGTLATPIYEREADIPEQVQINPLIEGDLPTPIDIILPEGWGVSIDDAILVRDIDALRSVPLTLYRGPVPGGTGYIAMYWGFPSLVAGDPIAAELGGPTPVPNLVTDGRRLLRVSVVEAGCNVGTGPERTYTLAEGRTGTGVSWSAVDCPELPDTRGWFVSTTHESMNFVFYAYLDPIDPLGPTPEEETARVMLQSILDSVRFRPLSDIMAPRADDSE